MKEVISMAGKYSILIRSAVVSVAAIALLGCLETSSTSSSNSGPPKNAAEAFERCVSPWDGNHEGFEALIRDILNDPGSMETHGTYFDPEDSIDDGAILIRLNYGAPNMLGGMVRNDAIGLMDVRTCEIAQVISYGE